MFHKVNAKYGIMCVVAVCSATPVLCGWKGFKVRHVCTMGSAEIHKSNVRIPSLPVNV